MLFYINIGHSTLASYYVHLKYLIVPLMTKHPYTLLRFVRGAAVTAAALLFLAAHV